jgi:vacuolar-type H+-ATPase subunit E/Vma4
LAPELIDRGHIVVDLGNSNKKVNAYICNKNFSSILDSNTAQSDPYYGGLIINAKDKNIEEIETILENRCYSSLF